MIVNAIILSNNVNVIRNILNNANAHTKISYKMVEEEEELIGELKKSHFDIIFVEKKFNIDLENKALRKYTNRIVIVEEDTNIEENPILENLSKNKVKNKIMGELRYLGYNFKHYGTNYLAEIILYAYENQDKLASNLQGDLYPHVAEKCGKTVSNVKSSVNRATECMYYECDMKRLRRYFNFEKDERPTVKEVIIAIIKNI